MGSKYWDSVRKRWLVGDASSARVTEAYLWKQLREGIPEAHWCRIENAAGSGIPDSSGCLNGVEAWVELKVSAGGWVHFRTSQRAWLAQAAAAGRRTFVLLRDGDAISLHDAAASASVPGKVVVPGKSFAVAIADMPRPLAVAKKPFGWGEIGKVLFGKPRQNPDIK